jgi:hypothetical protein
MDDFLNLVAPLVKQNSDSFVPPSKSHLDLHNSHKLPHFQHNIESEQMKELDLPKAQFEYWLHLFLRASALVSSRAFDVDSYHGTSMVPFADLYVSLYR